MTATCSVRGKAAIGPVMIALLLVGASGCGGAGGGSGPTGSGQGLVLVSFMQDSLDNVSLNTKLEFVFSEELDVDTVGGQSIQIREGGAFGFTVQGSFKVSGTHITFEPTLPSFCDLSDAGFKSDTQYRITLIGAPEEFALRNTRGQTLNETTTLEFHTRLDTDPVLFTDQIPGANPVVTAASPANGGQAVKVEDGNRVVLTISENLRPCTVDDTTVLFHIYQFGDPVTSVAADGGAGNPSGFATDVGQDTADQTPGDPYTWTDGGLQASVTTLPAPQKILAHIKLTQSFDGTQIILTPDFGYNANPLFNRSRFPEDALVVVQLTFGIQDLGGSPLTPFTLSFTTENLPAQDSSYTVETLGETPWDEALSTARIDESPPGLVQAFLLFSGDGDNGANLLKPTLPQSDPGSCANDYQPNDGTPDDFDPSTDVLFDTGSTANQCPNAADGSLAVVWEFATFRIRNGVTVRVIGINPAIILCQGDVVIENGGRLLLRGDNQGGSPRGAGEGNRTATTTSGCGGGIGVAGGGDGGACEGGNGAGSARYSGSGFQGYYHTGPSGPLASDVGDQGGTGAGHGTSSCYWTTQTPNNRNTPAGGGGGHAVPGKDGDANGTGSSPTLVDLTIDGVGGGTYGETNSRLVRPEAGSGGGAGAELRPFSGNSGRGPGGGGGAGGGFIDLTSGGDIVILGTIDAAGSIGGSNPGANFNPNYTYNPGVGGGGGGSGGGIRLLTPRDIVVAPSTVITAAGGAGGAGGATQGAPATPALNNGGNGGQGRIALEDGNSIISGLAGAGISPNEGSPGFYRGVFDATRFQGGGLAPEGVSGIFAVGPYNPSFVSPVQGDFVAIAPTVAVPSPGKTVMLIEIRGYEMLPDGSPDLTGVVATPTPWHTVGHFKDSGVEAQPSWIASQPPLGDIGGVLPPGNTGVFGVANIDGREFVQLRVTMYLKDSISATDPGHALDRWVIRFSSDQ